ncbi:MAG: hypothetical protein CMF31_09360 [Kordiimonas sp.]|nr:hypothetical protein [Kordiimonas sp.]|tara:strand:- start:2745 stop:3446 length:702 start_codon:yes stop_codon:yes gene_type:complete
MGDEANDAPKKAHYVGHRERLKQRFTNHGADSLQDYELLELLLTYAIPRRDVKEDAKNLLADFGGISDVLTADIHKLTKQKGIGEHSAILLKVVEAAALRLSQHKVLDQPILSNWQALLNYCQAAMAHKKIEQFRVLFLDNRNRLIKDECLQQGTVNHTPVYPREVIRRALDLHASAIILVHNHPSGDATPSRDDIEMTKKIARIGQELGVAVHDHLIIAKSGHNSFKSLGLL